MSYSATRGFAVGEIETSLFGLKTEEPHPIAKSKRTPTTHDRNVRKWNKVLTPIWDDGGTTFIENVVTKIRKIVSRPFSFEPIDSLETAKHHERTASLIDMDEAFGLESHKMPNAGLKETFGQQNAHYWRIAHWQVPQLEPQVVS